jgi:hypothetical protein
MTEEEKKMQQLPDQENLDLHSMDAEAEHASGWTLEGIDMKKAKLAFPVDDEDAIVRDGGSVNRVQQERIKEMRIPLTDELAKHIPVPLTTNSMPDYVTQDPSESEVVYSPELMRCAFNQPVHRTLNEAQKMGLTSTFTEKKYQSTARLIRVDDGKLALEIVPSMAYAPMQTAQRADEVQPMIGNDPGENVDIYKIGPNPYVVPVIAYDPSYQPPRAANIAPDMVIPGGMNQFFTARQDTFAANELEKIVVTNPLATQNALDKIVFSPALRNATQIPAAARQYMRPMAY